MSDADFQYEAELKDTLQEFFKSPTKERFPDILGSEKEYDYLDFKEEWFDKSKLARHILGFANAGGGALVIGVGERKDGALESVGLSNTEDEADLGNKVEKYTPDGMDSLYTLETYKYGDVYHDSISDKTFQVLFIDSAGQDRPLISANGGKNIDEAAIYTRRNSKTVRVNYEELQVMLKGREESEVGKSTAELHEELSELKTLYQQLDRKKKRMIAALDQFGSVDLFKTYENPDYPDETFPEFISLMIEKKKKRIEKRLRVTDIDLP